jgi:8-oxo-dGTP diphosphatase
MRHRVRVAALIVAADHILLVQHVHPETGDEWWVPPGGGMEDGDNSLFDCARRETFEETGLHVDLGRIVYIHEFLDTINDTYKLEIFLSSSDHAGELTTKHVKGAGPDEHFIKDARWVHKDDLQNLVVYPEILRDGFWEDVARGFPHTRYLGRSSDVE